MRMASSTDVALARALTTGTLTQAIVWSERLGMYYAVLGDEAGCIEVHNDLAAAGQRLDRIRERLQDAATDTVD